MIRLSARFLPTLIIARESAFVHTDLWVVGYHNYAI